MSPYGPDAPGNIDLGSGVYMRYVCWMPDRDLNPQYAHLEDEEKTGIIVGHIHEDGEVCEGGVMFDTPANRWKNEDGHRPTWRVESWEPLNLSPSILVTTCGLHGFIRNGQWVSA